ncbi:MAG: class I SAM-dependent methyltransferase, partial [Candidatus Thorarchaeota archaeon]
AIDPWRPFSVGKAKHLTKEMWTERYLSVCALQKWFSNLHILRMTSMEAAAVFRNSYFDLVFLDADHSYESTLADINAWLPLVKTGGWLTGHDYEREPGVKQAVTETFREVEVLSEDIWVKRIE